MSEEEFNALVQKDVRHGCTEDELNVLKANLREWLSELNALKRDVEVQLGAQKSRVSATHAEMLENGSSKADWLKYKSKEDSWRTSAVRFMVSVEQRMLHVKNLRAAANGNTKVMTA